MTGPQDSPPLTYAGLRQLVGEDRRARKFTGTTTVTIMYGTGELVFPPALLGTDITALFGERVLFCLRAVTLAVIGPEWVAFPAGHPVRLTVRGWLEHIARDNEIGRSVRQHGDRYVMDDFHPLAGHVFRVGGGRNPDAL